MPKFPDPTKQYSAEPISSKVDAAKTTTKPFTPPPISSQKPVFTSSPSTSPTSSSPPSSPPTPPTPPKSPPPNLPRKSPFANLIPLLIGGVVFLFLLFAVVKFVIPLFNHSSSSSPTSSKSIKQSGPKVTLTYWGLWEPASVFEPVIAAYEKSHPNVKINYQMQSPKNFRTRLQTAIQQKQGPDIVRIHNTWLPMLASYLAPAPQNLITAKDLDDFYPVFKHDFMINNKLYALPLEIDGLALYYNPNLFQQAHLTPPKDWNELRKTAFQLTTRNPKTKLIERAGIALGTTGNIAHWSDILGLLMLQNSADPSKPNTQEVQDALTFYTIFSTQDKVWDDSQPNSIYAFATGSVAMILAPSWQAAQIKALNPDLNFKIIPAPQLPNTHLAWATYWAEAVPVSSKHQKEAWEFLKYLSSPEALELLYQQETTLRGYGEPYPRKSMANLLQDDPINAAFVKQGPNYTSWYLADLTHDDGLNDQLINYYKDAVNALNQGSGVASVVQPLANGVQQVLSKYSLIH